MRNPLGLILVIVAAIAFVLFNALFIVDQREQALITQFGDPVRTVREPGLAVKVPFFQTVLFFDKRVLELDAPPEEVIAADKRRIVVDAFARYRISDALRFYQAVRTEAVARQRLLSIMSSSLRGVLGKRSLVTLLTDERVKLMEAIRDQLKKEARALGMDVIDVRIRRADLPKENLVSVFERMQTERQREAAGIRASGDEQATRIRSTAEKNVTIIKAEATRKSEILRGEGEAERNRILADAYGRDPEFFEFYRTLKAYEQSMTNENTTMVISPDSPFFKYFQRGSTGTR